MPSRHGHHDHDRQLNHDAMIQVSDPNVQAVIDELVSQRNVALDNAALLKGELKAQAVELAERGASIVELSNKIAELNRQLDLPPAEPNKPS